MSWNAVSGATGYHVVMSQDHRRTWTRVADNQPGTSKTVTGLDYTLVYYFAVAAVNSSGTSGWTNTPGVHPADVIPGPPRSVTATRSVDSISVSWSPPSNAGKSLGVTYDVNVSNDHRKSWSRHATEQSGTSATISVDNTLTWYVAVRAVTAGGRSGWAGSGPVVASFLILPAPSSVSIGAHTPLGMTVSWASVANADSYNVNLSANGGHSWSRVKTAATGASLSVDGTSWPAFDGSATYTAAVQAVDSGIGGSWGVSAPSKAAIPPGPPASVSAARSGVGEATVTWTPPINDGGSAVTGYDVNVSSNGALSWTRAASNVTGASATVSVGNDTSLVFAVRARNAAGGGDWRMSATVAGLAKPASVTAYRGFNFIDVEWPHVSGATGYDVNYSFNGGAWTRAHNAVSGGTGATRTARIAGLPNQSAHVVAVRARDAYGPGLWTNSAGVGFADFPLPVTGLSAARGSASGELDVSWTTCDTTRGWCTGGSPITEYWVNVSSNGGVSWTRAKTVAASAFTSGGTVALTGLNDDDAYRVAVSMRSRVGGKWANVSVAAVQRDLAADSVTATMATLTLTGHTTQWWYLANAAPDDVCRGPVAANTATKTLRNLTADTSYAYAAYSATGCASADKMAETTFTTPTPSDRAADGDIAEAALGIDNPYGIWENGTTMWVLDNPNDKILAFKMSDKSRDPLKDFDTLIAAENETPLGIWSDGTTMWVGDATDDKIYAYKMSDKSRDSSKDFDTLDAGNSFLLDIWSDGTTLWASDLNTDTIYAYKMSDKSRDSSKDFDLTGTGNNNPFGIWGDGVTLWVGDYSDNRLYAHSMVDKSRVPSRDYTGLIAAGNTSPGPIWSDGVTMWVTDYGDDEIYAYDAYDLVPELRATAAADTTATLTLAGHTGSWWLKKTAPTAGTCTAGETDFSHDLSSLDAGATYVYKAYDKSGCADMDEIAEGTFATVVLTSGGVTGTTATLTLSNYTGGWWLKKTAPTPAGTCTAGETDFSHDLSSLTANTAYAYKAYSASTCADADEIAGVMFETSTGLTASDVTLTTATLTLTGHTGAWWLKKTAPAPAGTCAAGEPDFSHAVSGLTPGGVLHVYRAYDASGCADANEIAQAAFATAAPGDPNPSEAIPTTVLYSANHNNSAPSGIWSDGATLWVVDQNLNKIFAYKWSDLSRDASKDFNTLQAAGLDQPVDLWSDGATMWVSDDNDDKIYAFKMSDKSRDSSKDFDTLSAAGNTAPTGIWSDGETMWAADLTDNKVYAYSMSDKARDSSKDFDTLSAAGNTNAIGIWSDGTTMWVSDTQDRKLYAYKMSDKTREAGKDIDDLGSGVNAAAAGIWSDGATLWVADRLRYRMYAFYAYPTLRSSGVGSTSATLTLGGHAGSWWLKKASPTPAGACTSGESDFSHALTGLTSNTTYTYKAYATSACAPASELKSITFTTPSS